MSTEIYAFEYAGAPVRFTFPNPDDHVARQIKDKRCFYEAHMLEHISNHLQPGCVVLDVGAHFGNHSIFFAKYCNPSKVYAFEPHPVLFAALQENVKINESTDKVAAYQLALGASNAIGHVEDAHANNSGMSRIVIDNKGSTTIRTLDGLLLGTLQRCDCIKLDVEGMEHQVLMGARSIIQRFRPIIYAECPHEAQYQQVLNELTVFGYESVQAFNATATYCFIYSGSQISAKKENEFPYRVAFFAGDEGNFHFAKDIIRYFKELGADVHVVDPPKVDVDQLCAEMKWCDLAWFEWANGPIIQASHLPKHCHIACRLHKYEIYTGAARSVNWNNVDDLILVSPHFVGEFQNHIDQNILKKTRINVIPNALDMDKFKAVHAKEKGFEIAYIARFHPDKNPALMLYIMHELVRHDDRYRCHMAGKIQDPVQYQYFQHMVEVLNLGDHVVYDGHIEDIHKWLGNKHYLLCTSVVESQGVGIMEAMAMGLKPLIHNHIGDPSCHFDRSSIFDTIDQAVEMILSEDYSPAEYRRYIENHYSLEKIQPVYRELVEKCIGTRRPAYGRRPRISIAIPTYNRGAFLREALLSALDQDYSDFEVLVVDDGSTDNTSQILAGFSNNSHLRVVKKSHTGAPDSRNRCITEASGEYLLWLDSDDLLMPNVLADYVCMLNRFPNADVVYPDLEIFDQRMHTKPVLYPDYYFSSDPLGRIVKSNLIPNGGSLVRRGLYSEIGLFDKSFTRAHDYEFWSRAIDRACFKHLGKVSYRWRWHGGNMSAENQDVDRSYEARIVCNLIQRFSLERLFPELDWNHGDAAHATAYARIANILSHWGASASAAKFVEKAEDVDSDNVEARSVRRRLHAQSYNARGETAYAKGDVNKALECFNESVQCDNTFVDGYVNLGALYWSEQDAENCVRCLGKALKLAPYNRTAVINTATVLAQLGKTQDALALSEGYLQQDPFSFEVQNIVGALNQPSPESCAAPSPT